MNLITLDFETYYDREYSLSKLTTEEYVRSPQFEVMGISIKQGDAPAMWYSQSKVEKALHAIDWSDKFVLCQNTAFDGAILNWRYGINPKVWCDTLGMSRALHPHDKSHSLDAQAKREQVGKKGDAVINYLGKHFKDLSKEDVVKYAEYCCNDTELTYLLFKKYIEQGFPLIELRLIDLTLRMYIEPVLELDRQMLVDHLADVKERKLTLLEDVRDRMLADADPDFVHVIFSEGTQGIKKLLMSNDKFATVLRSFNVDPPLKLSPTTGRQAYAFAKTDDGMKALLDHPDDRVQTLVAARLGNKTTLEETRTERFIGMSHRGKFPVPLRYYGAHSGRWSGQDKINLQNLPSRGTDANKIKNAIRAPEGYVIIDCDSAQIEARTLAWLAGQDDLVQAFENKEDVYKLMASRIFNKPPDQINKTERQIGKVVILGAGYGVGAPKLKVFLKVMAGVDVELDEAENIINAYRRTYSKIPLLWENANRALNAMGNGQTYTIDVQKLIKVNHIGLTLPNGLHIQYPNLTKKMVHSSSNWVYTSKVMETKVYGGLLVENVCQAVARCIVAEQMLKIGNKYKVVLTVHDAIACIAPIEEADVAQKYVEECMSWRPKWAKTLPLACESGRGASYGDC